MRGLVDLRLALRLLRGAGRRELVRLAATAVGVGLATFAVLAGLTAPRVAGDAHDIEAARKPVLSDGPAKGGSGLQVETSTAAVGDRPWTRVAVSGASPGAPVPPGISQWPAVGTSIVSPALKQLLRKDARLAAGLGPVSHETVGPAGLTSPDELVSYTVSDSEGQAAVRTPGEDADDDGSDGSEVTGFGRSGDVSEGSGMLLALEVAALVLTPAALFLVTVLRLSAASRARRSFALSLAGMSPSRAARLYSREMALVAAVGYLLGIGSFAAVQGPLGSSGLLGLRWWPEQGRLGTTPIVLTGVLAIALVTNLARRSMVATTARGRAARHTEPARWAAWTAVLLGLPAGGFLVVTSLLGAARPSDVWASDPQSLMILGSIVAAVIAVVLGVPRVIGALAEWIAVRGAPALALGLRGAAYRVPSSQRLIAFVACSVMVAGISTAFVTSLHRTAFGDADEATISFGLSDVSSDPAWVSKLPDGPFTVQTSLPGTAGMYTVVVGDCSAVMRQAAAVFSRPGSCKDSVERASDGVIDGATATTVSVGNRSVDIPATAPETTDVTWALKFPVADAPWLPDLRTGDVTYWVSRDDQAYQDILTTLAERFPGLQVQAGMRNPDQYADYRKQVGTVRAAVCLGVLLSICAFLVTALENRWERSRSVAMLAAIGAGARDLRTANLAEFAFPVAVAGIPAAVVGVLGGWAVVSINGSDGMFTSGVAVAATAGAGVCLLLAAIVGWSTGGATFRREAVADS